MTPRMREALHLLAEHASSNVVSRDAGDATRLHADGTVVVNPNTARALERAGLVRTVERGRLSDARTQLELVLTDAGAEELARQLGDR